MSNHFDPTDLHRDLRRLIDAVENLLERGASPIAAPIEQMLRELTSIEGSLNACAIAMMETCDAVQVLAARPDPMSEIMRLRHFVEATL